MKILAIETSCDDTGIAILEILGDLPSRKASARRSKKSPDFNVLSNIIASQIEVHKKYGGVYPMMAKREHQRNLLPTFKKALRESKLLKAGLSSNLTIVKFDAIKKILKREPELEKKLIPFLEKYKKPDIDLIAVTNGPGLEPCLWVGVNFARALSYFWDISVVPVNHIESHILVNFLNRCNNCADAQSLQRNELFPAVCLVVSGGHTQLILMKKIGDYEILGETRDDAAGECFDKAAKILGLGYPGGPAIAEFARQWKSQIPKSNNQPNSKSQIPKLPRPMINTKDYDFSFSGLKTAILYHHQKQGWPNSHDRRNLDTLKFKQYKRAMCVEIQQAVIDVLLKKTIKATKDYNAKTIILGGGVSANEELRKQFRNKIETELCGFLPNGKKPHIAKKNKINFFVPEPNLSTDNALMIAITAYFHRNKKVAMSDITTLRADANLRLGC